MRRSILTRFAPAALLGLLLAPGLGTAMPPTALPPETLRIGFASVAPGRIQVDGLWSVPAKAFRVSEAGFYNLEMEGRVLVDGRPYDTFAYRFDVQEGQANDAPLGLVFERNLRSGDFRIELEVHDLSSDERFRVERDLVVPPGAAGEHPISADPAPEPPDAEPSLELLPPDGIAVGRQRIGVSVIGPEIDHVTFSLDGEPLLTKHDDLYSVEVDLGLQPRPRLLAAVAYDAAGNEIARDETTLNYEEDRFEVEIVEPRAGERVALRTAVAVELEVPRGRRVERVDLYLDDREAGNLQGPPWRGSLARDPEDAEVLQVVARLDDGSTAEDAILMDGRRPAEELDVDLVELYAAIVDGRGHLVDDVRHDEVRVLEDGSRQDLQRFEQVRNLPISVGLVLDTSSSMASTLPEVVEAATSFVQRVLGEEDRCLLVTFSSRPWLQVPLSRELPLIVNRLQGLTARGGTALHDSLIFTMGRLPATGQRAILLLSDGRDVDSAHTAEGVLELARYAGLTIYTIGIDTGGKPDLDRKLLRQLAAQTGGRSFLVEDADELGAAFAGIEADLRSRYLLTYHSSHPEDDRSFRAVQVQVARQGVEARTMAGYYP